MTRQLRRWFVVAMVVAVVLQPVTTRAADGDRMREWAWMETAVFMALQAAYNAVAAAAQAAQARVDAVVNNIH